MKLINQNLATEYYDIGEGKIILLLHGWQDNLNTFSPLKSELLVNYRVLSLDLPGFGGSEYPQNKILGLDDYISFVESFISKLGLDVYAVIGHSFGGRIIIKGVATNKLRPKKVILIGSAGLISQKPLKYILRLVTKAISWVLFVPPLIFWREKIRQKFYKLIGSDYFTAGQMSETYKKIISEDLTISARNIHIPTLLIWGELDRATPVSVGQKFNRLIKNSELHIVKNAGHFVHQDNQEEVVKIIKNFL